MSCRVPSSSCTWYGIFASFKNECFYGSILFTLLGDFLTLICNGFAGSCALGERTPSEQQTVKSTIPRFQTLKDISVAFLVRCVFSIHECFLSTQLQCPQTTATCFLSGFMWQSITLMAPGHPWSASHVRLLFAHLVCWATLKCEEKGPVDFCYCCAP